jgi:hypothetical protein
LVTGGEVSYRTLSQQWSRQALGYNKRIITECSKQLAQNFRLLRILSYPVHFSL